MFYEKQDTYKTIKDLTFYIGNLSVDMQTSSKWGQNIDLVSCSHADANYIRKQMQVNNEDLYYFYLYINIYSNTKESLEYNLNKVEGILQSHGIYTKRAYFRQEDGFISSLPIMKNEAVVKEIGKRNLLTNSMLATYPFITSSIFDKNGIFIGKNRENDGLIMIDSFNTTKYKNANMSIFGTSGAGKSFFAKLLIFRYRLLGITQFIIDPEREYENLCNSLNGTFIKIGMQSSTYINIFDIREESIEDGEDGYLRAKITKLISFLSLIFGDLLEEEKSVLEEKIVNCYNKKGITFQNNSLYSENGKFKNKKQMPILEDLYNELKKAELKKFYSKLYPFVFGSLSYFNHYTNVEVNNKLIVADLYDLGEENLKYGMLLFTIFFWDKIKKNRIENKIIYLDEIWKLIGITTSKTVAGFIYNIFKTIRKYGGSAIAITQDIEDLFSFENGGYGKSILNNTAFKVFFNLEEENIKQLKQYTSISEEEALKIRMLKRGECLFWAGNDHILVKIESSKQEKDKIEKRGESL